MIRFLRNESGHIAVMTVIALVPILGLMGSVMDLVRVTSAQHKLQRALDAATLASASLTQAGDAEETVRSYVEKNLAGTDLLDDLTVTVASELSLNSRHIKVNASTTQTPLFLPLLGISTMDIEAESVAVESATNIEISMVLDISVSMIGSKMSELKDAGKDFVEEMLNDDRVDTTSISLIPFGGTVNIGDYADDFLVPKSAGTTILNPTEAQYDIGTSVPNTYFRFDNTTYFPPGNPGHPDYGSDCIELRNEDYNDWDKLPLSDRSQVPNFWIWYEFASWCPYEKSAVFFNSNDETVLKQKIDDMVHSDGTGLHIGTAWGAYALSPEWRGYFGGDFADRPRDLDDDVIKVLVLMTDGEITEQYRPEDYRWGSIHTNRHPDYNQTLDQTPYHNYGNAYNYQRILDDGTFSDSNTSNTAKAQMKRMCDYVKAQGVTVYTIGFQIAAGADSDKLLEYCASSASQYYFVEDLDISSAFEAIARSINALRIVG